MLSGQLFNCTGGDVPARKAALKLVFTTMIRAAGRWCSVSISDLGVFGGWPGMSNVLQFNVYVRAIEGHDECYPAF
jgi:hypothetical protein